MLADNPADEWNTLRIVMVGARASVQRNGKQTVDHATMENYYDRRAAPRTISSSPRGPPMASSRFSTARTSPAGPDRSTTPKPSTAPSSARRARGGHPYYGHKLRDFAVRPEFKLPSAGNDGLAIRYPGKGDPACDAMCKLQVLAKDYEKVKGKLAPRQLHGSAYGMVGAQCGFQRPIGEWNFQEVTVVGSTPKVELNGFVILDADLVKVDLDSVMGKKKHPSLALTEGYLASAGHSDPVAFRNISIRELADKYGPTIPVRNPSKHGFFTSC